MKLSAIVLTKNEENNIEKCLNSLAFCDEIVVVDDESTDDTVAIAKKKGAKVFRHALKTNFAAQRNYGLSKASGEWTLFVDADEVVPSKLVQEILIEIMREKNTHHAYYMRRCDYFMGKRLSRGELSDVHGLGLIRLVKKGSGKWQGQVHERFVTDKSTGKLHNCLNHFPHPTLKHFIERINYYSTIRANELYQAGRKPTILEIMFVPGAKFVYTFFFRLGFLDGAEGFMYSFLMSFHSFLVRVKLFSKWYAHKS